MLTPRLWLLTQYYVIGFAGLALFISKNASHAFGPEPPQTPVLFQPPTTNPSANIVETIAFDQQPPRTSGRPPGLPFGLEAEWINGPEVDLATYDASVKLPLLFGFGSPPPIVKIGFGYTDVAAADSFGLPEELYEYSFGVSWVRQFNHRWAMRTMLGTSLATDNLNTSSDAWRFRGGVFAIYDSSPQWKWTFGAIALGRNDLPVLPAVGAVWQPNETTRFDLLLPNPRANFLLSDDGRRQQWAYLGGGLNGNTWAFETTDLADDTLTYGDVRVVAGWQSRPTAPPGTPYVPGRKYNLEVGYAFSRDLEFEDDVDNISLDNALMFRISTSY